MTLRELLPRRTRLDTAQFEEIRSILRAADRADLETLAAIATELRAQIDAAPSRVKAEVDGVIDRIRTTHSKKGKGGEAMNGPVAPTGGRPEDEQDDV